ncbi:hypothetical protein [Nonomuraea wenchangensis]|uniref:Uncharacterized protein n=1 Tax=Nonomuraea wenchangensis TaxID=568860 RepID=A0A1I0LTI6_9ACTN|nr:hypothetical protein [Nonomuraea wenchangensis]SEU46418.1 hypothetical protein SAMN05421811_12729 [Nonomuraea wenchangensis]
MSTAADFQKRAMDEAVQALAKRLRERDATEPGQREPADVFARRFITDMNGHGWRLTPAGRVNPLARRPPDDPTAVTQRGAALAFAELAKVIEKRAGINQDEGDEA